MFAFRRLTGRSTAHAQVVDVELRREGRLLHALVLGRLPLRRPHRGRGLLRAHTAEGQELLCCVGRCGAWCAGVSGDSCEEGGGKGNRHSLARPSSQERRRGHPAAGVEERFDGLLRQHSGFCSRMHKAHMQAITLMMRDSLDSPCACASRAPASWPSPPRGRAGPPATPARCPRCRRPRPHPCLLGWLAGCGLECKGWGGATRLPVRVCVWGGGVVCCACVC